MYKFAIIFLLVSVMLFGQEEEYFCSHANFNLGVSNTGIGFGNSEYHNGLRFNISDCEVKSVNGINVTFWKPVDNYDFEMNGIALGLAPMANRMNGISIGLLANISITQSAGFNFASLANVSEGNLLGINIGGLANVAEGQMQGINFG